MAKHSQRGMTMTYSVAKHLLERRPTTTVAKVSARAINDGQASAMGEVIAAKHPLWK